MAFRSVGLVSEAGASENIVRIRYPGAASRPVREVIRRPNVSDADKPREEKLQKECRQPVDCLFYLTYVSVRSGTADGVPTNNELNHLSKTK